MGTHPIFESDFDCLTDKNGHKVVALAAKTIEDEIRKKINNRLVSHQKDLRSKYKFEYNDKRNVTGWALFSSEQLKSGSFDGHLITSRISHSWQSLTESEREHWREKAEIENTKRAEANMPAILEALENNDLLALTSYEMSKYSPG